MPNNTINSDSEKRRAFVAWLLTSGCGERYSSKRSDIIDDVLLLTLPVVSLSSVASVS
jgi:hypothetical protein